MKTFHSDTLKLVYTTRTGSNVEDPTDFFTVKQLRLRAKALRAAGSKDFKMIEPSGKITSLDFPKLD